MKRFSVVAQFLITRTIYIDADSMDDVQSAIDEGDFEEGHDEDCQLWDNQDPKDITNE